MSRFRFRIAGAVAATALTIGVAAAVAADPPPSEPVYPPPGGVTLASEGDNGRAGGGTWTYTDLQMHLFQNLWWSVHDGDLPQLSMDGETDEPGETMVFSAGQSDLAQGVLVFTGSAELPNIGTFPTSVTITTTTVGGGPVPMDDAAGAGLPGVIGGAAVVPGDFKANVLFRVNGQPAKDFFDAARTNPAFDDGNLKTSIRGAFYYVPANELPVASFTWEPASPKALQAVTFTSTSTDSDGTIADTAWDLDGDGEYDDATGTSASRTFAEAGEYSVGVRVVDDRGAVATDIQTVTVRTCEPGIVSQSLRSIGALAGIEPTVRSLNCDVLEPLGL